MIKIELFHQTQHGFPVCLVKYDQDGDIATGFTLISHHTKEEQVKYAEDLAALTGFPLEDHT